MKKIFFASDFHLGIPNHSISLQREKLLIKWLENIKHEADEIFLMGDIFDFWHEWKQVVPKGHTRFLGKIVELADSGIKINYITGNHDLWVYDYFQKELGIKVYHKPIIRTFNNKKFLLAHGDGLGPNDKFYKILKKLFTNKFLQFCFANLIHPNLSIKIAKYFSETRNGYYKNPRFLNEDEWLIIYSRELLKTKKFDFFIYGHRHIPIKKNLNESSVYVGLGDWLKNNTYAVFDGKNVEIIKFT